MRVLVHRVGTATRGNPDTARGPPSRGNAGGHDRLFEHARAPTPWVASVRVDFIAVSFRSSFETLDVSSWPLVLREPAGREPKDWLEQPKIGQRWLFKPIHQNQAGLWQGEDWAEKVASELASLMGVTHARVEFARRGDQVGCISRDVTSPNWELHAGAVALTAVHPDFRVKNRERTGHSLGNIHKVLFRIGCPSDALVPASFSAYDLFCGYLVFDAWIANRDRHEENWAVLRPPPGSLDRDCLSPSFDHASSLGFQLQDHARSEMLSRDGVAAWAERGTAWRFEHPAGGPPPTLVQHARNAFTTAADGVASYWMAKVESVRDTDVDDVLRRATRMSEPARRFAMELLRVNRRRLLT